MSQRILLTFISVVFFSAFTSSAIALDKVNLKPEAFKNAKGDATIVRAGTPEQRRIDLRLSGLEPNGVYSVWFNERGTEKQTPASKEDASFKSDANGNARFSTVLNETEIERWDEIQVAYHPDGNAQNMEMAILMMSGNLPPDV